MNNHKTSPLQRADKVGTVHTMITPSGAAIFLVLVEAKQPQWHQIDTPCRPPSAAMLLATDLGLDAGIVQEIHLHLARRQ